MFEFKVTAETRADALLITSCPMIIAASMNKMPNHNLGSCDLRFAFTTDLLGPTWPIRIGIAIKFPQTFSYRHIKCSCIHIYFCSCGKLSSAISKTSHDVEMVARFLTLSDVAELLNIAPAQVYTLVRTGELPAIKIGARGQWRVEDQAIESYIAKLYSSTAEFVAQNPR
jgi:excisionase family DNA binding protein